VVTVAGWIVTRGDSDSGARVVRGGFRVALRLRQGMDNTDGEAEQENKDREREEWEFGHERARV